LPSSSVSQSSRNPRKHRIGWPVSSERRSIVSVTVSQYKNFVGGESVDAVEGATMEVLNPATGETIAEVPSGTEADVARAVEAAKKALPEWLETDPGERAEALLKLADAIEDNAEELAELESVNVGKPLS